MLLAIDIGNTSVVVALMKSDSDIIFKGRFATVKTDTVAEISPKLDELLRNSNENLFEIKGVIVCSVVPEITDAVVSASQEITGRCPLVVSHELETGILIKTDVPEKTGADLIAGAAGAAAYYDGVLAIFDLGTATTLSVVDEERNFLGGMIMPGVYVSMDAMVSRASQLPKFDIDSKPRFIGKNTVECMQSGIIYQNAAMMDELSDRVEYETGKKVTTIVTGGLGGKIYPYCRRRKLMHFEPDLVLKGLWYIYEKNKTMSESNEA